MIDFSPGTNQKTAIGDGAFDKRLRRHVTGRNRDYYVVTAPGFEALCRRELIDLGLDGSAMTVAPGGVTFRGRLVDCQQANLKLRTATRILMRVASFMATNRRRLEKNTDRIAWELFFSAGGLPGMKVSSHRSRLYHTEAITQTITGCIARRLMQEGRVLPVTGPQTLFVRVVEDRFTLSLDSSGDPLYKRGFKPGTARAPIRETLATAILMSAGYDGAKPLVDPMSGSGTFSLEAAMLAKQIPPGINREFAFMGWPAYNNNQWAFLKREAESKVQQLDRPRIFASDMDPVACEHLTQTIVRNGLSDAIAVEQKDFFDCRADHYGNHPGLVVINPPYGIRLGSYRQADDLFTAVCRHLKAHFYGWTVALITPNHELARQVPFASRHLPMIHGGLKLSLVIGAIGG